MDLIKDLRAQKKEIQKQISARAQLRKRSKDSIARPKAKKIFFQTIHVYKGFSCINRFTTPRKGASPPHIGTFSLTQQHKEFWYRQVESNN